MSSAALTVRRGEVGELLPHLLFTARGGGQNVYNSIASCFQWVSMEREREEKISEERSTEGHASTPTLILPGHWCHPPPSQLLLPPHDEGYCQ